MARERAVFLRERPRGWVPQGAGAERGLGRCNRGVSGGGERMGVEGRQYEDGDAPGVPGVRLYTWAVL
jgi:hypothetical protein